MNQGKRPNTFYYTIVGKERHIVFSFNCVLRQSKTTTTITTNPFIQIGKQRHLKFVSRAEKNIQNKYLVRKPDVDDTEMRYAERECSG